MEVMDAVESTLGPKVYRNNYVVHYAVAAPFFARGLRLGRRGKISILHLRAALQPKKVNYCPDGETGRRTGLKIPSP
jgi:hypothetical protein